MSEVEVNLLLAVANDFMGDRSEPFSEPASCLNSDVRSLMYAQHLFG